MAAIDRQKMNLALVSQRILARLALMVFFWSAAGSCAHAVDLDGIEQAVHAQLLAETDSVVPGRDVALGVRLRHAPHWHTYWEQPGDAGLPTRLQWKLDPGYAAGPIQWPVPRRLRVGSLANYGYEGEILLPVTVHVPAQATLGSTAHFAVHADWLVCSDLCVPGGADLTLALPVRAAGASHASADAPAFAAVRRLIPSDQALAGARATADGTHVQLEFPLEATGQPAAPHQLEFFALDGGRIQVAGVQTQRLLTDGAQRRVRLEMPQATPVEPGFTTLRGVLVADGGPDATPPGWIARVAAPVHSSAALAAGGASAGAASPPGAIGATGPAGASATPAPPPASPGLLSAAPPSASADAAPAASPDPVAPTAEPLSWAFALVGAFLGGLILNLMPCVFPVLSLKLIGLVQHSGESKARMRAHGLAYTAGVMLSFLALAGLLLVLRVAGSQIGWGFQLQSPLVIAALIGLFFLIGLNLLGTFEFTAGAALANSRAAQALDGEGVRGSFATGVLAAVVASPCTAPFMGAALGYAVTQPAPVALLVFAALGAGMAAPYLLLTLSPALLRRLPRPGLWMERLRQFMAFPMFLTCVWLFWVLGQQTDMNAVAWMLLAIVGVGLAAWAWGLAQRGAPSYRWIAAAAAVAVVLTALPLSRASSPALPLAAAPVPGVAPGGAATPADWAGWSPQVQQSALADGRAVFVDFTAAWCITCQANKRLVLGDERVVQAFVRGNVLRLEADWTRRDETIARELTRFHRSGVPMYVLYDRRGTPHLLPEILSTDGVLAALAAI